MLIILLSKGGAFLRCQKRINKKETQTQIVVMTQTKTNSAFLSLFKRILFKKGQLSIAPFTYYFIYFAKNFPVYDFSHFTTSSGVPSAITSPPFSPPSGPKSIM